MRVQRDTEERQKEASERQKDIRGDGGRELERASHRQAGEALLPAPPARPPANPDLTSC